MFKGTRTRGRGVGRWAWDGSEILQNYHYVSNLEEARSSVLKEKHVSLHHIDLMNFLNANYLHSVQKLGSSALYSSQLCEEFSHI